MKTLKLAEIWESRMIIHDVLKALELTFEKRWGFEEIYNIPKLRLSETTIDSYIAFLGTKHQGSRVKEMVFLAKRLKSLYAEEALRNNK
jgi:hypothetical protein